MRRTHLHATIIAGGTALLTALIAPTAQGAVGAKPYASYQQVNSGTLVAAPNAQTVGEVSCPKGTKVVGGGASVVGAVLTRNISGSYPVSATTWRVKVANATSTAGTFTVLAVCVKKVPKYTIVSGLTVTNLAHEPNHSVATCPAKTIVLGGGGLGGSTSPMQTLNDTLPQGNGWQVDSNNASSTDSTVTAWAVCGAKPSGYTVVTGPATTLAPFTQASSKAVCPSSLVTLSGGALSNTGSTLVNLNTTAPSGDGSWVSYENNNSNAATTTVTSYAVCAQAS